MKKIVLHFSNTDIRTDSRILKELEALEGFSDVQVSAIGLEKNNWSKVKKVYEKKIEGIRLFTHLLSWLPRAPRYVFNLVEVTVVFVVRGMSARPAIVHCHDAFVLPAGALLKIITGCKLVYDAHELESNKNSQSFVLSKATLLIEKLSWKYIDLLIAVSYSILKWYKTSLGLKENILILNSPKTNRKKIKFCLRNSRRRYFNTCFRIPQRMPIFLYLGLLERGRGIELALEVFSSTVLKAHLVFVGDGPLKKSITSFCKRHNNIHLHRPVPHESVTSLASNADFGLCLIENVSLSDYLSLPNKLFEYCFAGVRVLGSDFPEIKKVIREYSLGTCCALDKISVRKAVKFLISSKPPCATINLSPLSWDLQANRLVRAYKKMVK